MSEILLEQDTQELVKKAELIERDFVGCIVSTNAGYTQAGEELKRIKTLSAEIEAKRMSMTKPLNESLKRINEFFKALAARPAAAEANIKTAMLKFQREQEEIRRKEEERLRELARQEIERRRKTLENKAQKAEAKGNVEKAEELRQQKEEVFIPAPIVESQVAKVNGIKTTTVWKFRLVNPALIPRDFLIPDEKAIGAFIRATKGTKQIPGVEIYSEEVLAAGRA